MTTSKQKYKYNLCGISTNGELTDKIKDMFEECYDGTLIKKEPFKVYLDTKEIALHTYIETTYMSEYSDDDNTCIVTLGVIPDFNSLTEKYQENIIEQFSDDDKEYMLQHQELLLKDILDYGFSIPLHNATVEPDILEHTVNSAFAVHYAVEGLIGFDLDKILNGIGNTGWDFLSDYCEGADLLQLARNRFKEVNKGV